MPQLIPSEKIYIATSIVVPQERGVFARIGIKKGEIIETCPVIEISEDDTHHIDEASLVTYMFYFGEKKEQSLLALGFGSLYNHSSQPNATYTISPHEKTITFTALKDIKKDEEITVNYNQENKNKNPLWFETR